MTKKLKQEFVFSKCKEWVNSLLDLGSMCQGYQNNTPYLHCLVYHIPYCVVTYGKLVNYSGQGVEKINDDIKKIHQSKTNKYDATIDALKVRKRIEYLSVIIIKNLKDIGMMKFIIRDRLRTAELWKK